MQQWYIKAEMITGIVFNVFYMIGFGPEMVFLPMSASPLQVIFTIAWNQPFYKGIYGHGISETTHED